MGRELGLRAGAVFGPLLVFDQQGAAGTETWGSRYPLKLVFSAVNMGSLPQALLGQHILILKKGGERAEAVRAQS